MRLVLVTHEYLARECFNVVSSLRTLNRAKCDMCKNTTRSFVVYNKGAATYNLCVDCHWDVCAFSTPLYPVIGSLRDDND